MSSLSDEAEEEGEGGGGERLAVEEAGEVERTCMEVTAEEEESWMFMIVVELGLLVKGVCWSLVVVFVMVGWSSGRRRVACLSVLVCGGGGGVGKMGRLSGEVWSDVDAGGAMMLLLVMIVVLLLEAGLGRVKGLV